MQIIIIKIPEEIMEYIKNNGCLSVFYIDEVAKAIKNGTPLPKGHGRLGDLDVIWNKLKELEAHYQDEFLKDNNIIHDSAMGGRLYGFSNAKFIVQDAPTIIEADKNEPTRGL